MQMDLVSVLRRAYQSEIDVTLRSRWDLGWQLEIEDGQVAREIVSSLDEAASWFDRQIIAHFPNSLYSQGTRGEIRTALPDEAAVRRLDGT
jgi:hypothetical protein